MPLVSCPVCGEPEDLTGEPGDDEIVLSCGRCGAGWVRLTRPVCGLCGSEDVEGIPTATLVEHGRANVEAPSGVRLAYYCWDCGGKDVASAIPDPGPYLPPGTSGRDVKALRQEY